VSDQELLAMIEEAIKDELRIGTPVTFSAEQVTQIALACSEPLAGTTNQSLGARKLRQSNQTRDCQTISTRSVERFLKEADLKPHQSRYWLNANPSDPQAFAIEVETVCVVCSSN